MKQKINIAQLLKDCKGMELDCLIFEDVTLYSIDTDTENEYPIRIVTKNGYFLYLTKYGTYSNVAEAKCVIFPKGKTTWEGFVPFCQFKDGDIVATSSGLWIGITTGGEINSFIPTYCVIKHNGEFEAYLDKKQTWQFSRLATEKEKQKLFNAIKTNGYKWNLETKTLEKLSKPNFKVGDRIKKKGIDDIYAIEITAVTETIYTFKNGGFKYVDSTDKDYELVPNK